ncbi:Barstar (barnase inhibitor) [Thioalkalivibrio nitratireducens DSM 14787]|uniref:Barstar (Barnase inhibitor) n=1 Tax=Thioalkalivibrio nitratireducens (strain DSM 14787 / UNIQEM 213 / ALEN2) TaxID=1255043 RepID=L0DZM2_THIND|nr:barstar family protein [Thioalkalivibrio nitratireducens]AGA34437.1 Barstar (barnase inhibitor) [Thioalkalivibrio nitratireducens DSM 14787]
MPPPADPSTLPDWLAGPEPLLELPGGSDPAAVLDALRHGSLDAQHVDLVGVADKAMLLDRLHQALGFGAWFGFNWDALEEALFGPENRSGPERVLVVTGFEGFRERDPAAAEVFVDILRTVARTPGSGLRGAVLVH